MELAGSAAYAAIYSRTAAEARAHRGARPAPAPGWKLGVRRMMLRVRGGRAGSRPSTDRSSMVRPTSIVIVHRGRARRSSASSTYNGLIRSRNQVENAWSQIDVQLKRRYNLIPNLVETVKAYAAHEKDTLDGDGPPVDRAADVRGRRRWEDGADQQVVRHPSAVGRADRVARGSCRCCVRERSPSPCALPSRWLPAVATRSRRRRPPRRHRRRPSSPPSRRRRPRAPHRPPPWSAGPTHRAARRRRCR